MTRRHPLVAALVAASALLVPAAAARADGTPPHPRMSEKQLRAFETRLLGPAHAAQHAELRRLERREKAAARRHARWLRSLSPGVRRAVLRKERLRKQRAAAKNRAFMKKADAGPPAQVGQWTTGPFPLNTPDGHHVMGINAAVLPTGKVLYYSYPTNPNPSYGAGTGSPNEATAFLWDPAKGTGTNSFQEFKPPADPGDPGHPANIWCSGISFLPDGTVLVTGGNYRYDPDWEGLDTVYTFNPFTEKWHYEGKMHDGRWYPTQTLLPDGRTVITSGYGKVANGGADGKSAVWNQDIEVYDPSKPEGQRIYLIAHRTSGSGGSSLHPPTGGLYPHTFVMPSGNVLVAGPFIEDSWLFRAADVPTSDTGLPWQDFQSTGSALPKGPRDQIWGTGVILPSTNPAAPSTQIQLMGGNFPGDPNTPGSTESTDYAINGVASFDDANRSAGWKQEPSMNVGRGHANTVLLPDGSMVTVGGGYGIVNNNQWLTNETTQRQVELWNPGNHQWTLGPAQVESRAYHSTAVLLPDGRVVSAGDDWNGSDPSGNPVEGGTYGISDDTAEIYSPPYLFKGPRPTITAAPSASPYGGTISVDTPDSTTGMRAALVAPSATTHANDMNQRFVALSVQPRAGGVNLTAPANANITPPGYYMLFLVNSNGVPSVATWVRIGAGIVQPPVNAGPPAFSGSAATGSVLTETTAGVWGGSGLSFTRQWRRCNSFGESCTDIAGANATTYTVTAADVGSTLRLRVTASNASGSIPSDSAQSGVVPTTPGCPCPDGSGPGGCPSCTGPGSADTTAPKLSFHAPSSRTLKALLKSGLTLRVKCSEACTLSGILDLHVTVVTKSGKKRKRTVKVYVVGRSKTATASSGGKVVSVRIRLSSSGKKRLRRVKPRRVRLTLTAKDKAGNKAKASRTIRIKRR